MSVFFCLLSLLPNEKQYLPNKYFLCFCRLKNISRLRMGFCTLFYQLTGAFSEKILCLAVGFKLFYYNMQTLNESLFSCLKAGYENDKSLINAFLNKMSIHLYPRGNDDQHTSLRQMNAVLAIGHIACALKEIANVTESGLTILQQRFHHPPSQLDVNIIEQFAPILLTGVVRV